MVDSFKDCNQQLLYSTVLGGLRSLGYDDSLLIQNYKFADWFAHGRPERTLSAAAFGQTPFTSDSACFGIAVANGVSQDSLITRYRALGAPVFFEIGDSSVREWVVGPKAKKAQKLGEYSGDEIKSRFVANAEHWNPSAFLRAKNIGDFKWSPQLRLFSGLLPELEHDIQEVLVPLLRSTLSATMQEYNREGRAVDPQKMFQLIFWLLTGKVFHDRGIRGFRSIDGNSADSVLEAVAKHYRTEVPRLLTKQSRDVAFSRIWSNQMDFRNLSVDVLADTWSKALVTDEDRSRLGIHRTSRTLATYIVDRLPFEGGDSERLTVLEPCCGSAVFLVAAMHKLRGLLWGLSPQDRHEYFIRHLIGLETDPFGVEISWLVLTLADFPNANGWQIRPTDVFHDREALAVALRSAGVVLCNPPFEPFKDDERAKYGDVAARKPVELMRRILTDLHPTGVLGLILPRNIIDGQEYVDIRRQLAERFANIEITAIPDKAFDADHEVALVVATNPIPHKSVTVHYRRVLDTARDWHNFERHHAVSSEDTSQMSVTQATTSLAIPELSAIWNQLRHCPTLKEVAPEMHRGIEWKLKLTKKVKKHKVETGNREKLVLDHAEPGFDLGVPPDTTFQCLTVPDLAFLDMRENSQDTGAWKLAWHLPKVFLNAVTKSRKGWRLAAFADDQGLVGYQNITAIWPLKMDVAALAAVLNGPVANAFIATREGKRHVTIEILRDVPIPVLTREQQIHISELAREYQRNAAAMQEKVLYSDSENSSQRSLLLRIDAAVLAAYALPPRLERQLLDFFNSDDASRQMRPVPFVFGDYFPRDFKPHFSLGEYISKEFKGGTLGEWRRDIESIPDNVRSALKTAAGG